MALALPVLALLPDNALSATETAIPIVQTRPDTGSRIRREQLKFPFTARFHAE